MATELQDENDSLARQTRILSQQTEQQKSEIETLRQTIIKLREELEQKDLQLTNLQASNRTLYQQQEQSASQIKELERSSREANSDLQARLEARQHDIEAREANFSKIETEYKVSFPISYIFHVYFLSLSLFLHRKLQTVCVSRRRRMPNCVPNLTAHLNKITI